MTYVYVDSNDDDYAACAAYRMAENKERKVIGRRRRKPTAERCKGAVRPSMVLPKKWAGETDDIGAIVSSTFCPIARRRVYRKENLRRLTQLHEVPIAHRFRRFLWTPLRTHRRGAHPRKRIMKVIANSPLPPSWPLTVTVMGADSVVALYTGAAEHLGCFNWLGRRNSVPERRGVPRAETSPACARIKFGDGGLHKARRAADIHVGIAGGRRKFTACAQEADTPALLRRGPSEALGGRPDSALNVWTLGRLRADISLEFNGMGHYVSGAASYS